MTEEALDHALETLPTLYKLDSEPTLEELSKALDKHSTGRPKVLMESLKGFSMRRKTYTHCLQSIFISLC